MSGVFARGNESRESQRGVLTFIRLLSKTDTTTNVEECAEGRGDEGLKSSK